MPVTDWTPATYTREQIAASARSLINTPFLHQGRLKGVAIDCIGEIILVARDIGSVAPDHDFTGYGRSPDGSMIRLCAQYGVRIPHPKVGAVGVFSWGQSAHHMGIFVPYKGRADTLAIVHALGPFDPGKVIESRLLPNMRMFGVFDFPGVSD